MSHDARPTSPLKPLLAVLSAGVAVVVLFFAGVAAQQVNSKQPVAAAEPTRTPSEVPPQPGLGDKVRDGKFEFVVSRVDCAHRSVGLEHLKRTAQGKYCIVSLSVRNIADGSRYFLGQAQKAYDAAGTAYGDDTLAGVYANRNTETFLQKLDPGERVTGKLVFDVPKQVRVTRLELHDSPLSGGAAVTLKAN